MGKGQPCAESITHEFVMYPGDQEQGEVPESGGPETRGEAKSFLMTIHARTMYILIHAL